MFVVNTINENTSEDDVGRNKQRRYKNNLSCIDSHRSRALVWAITCRTVSRWEVFMITSMPLIDISIEEWVGSEREG